TAPPSSSLIKMERMAITGKNRTRRKKEPIRSIPLLAMRPHLVIGGAFESTALCTRSAVEAATANSVPDQNCPGNRRLTSLLENALPWRWYVHSQVLFDS